MRSAVFKWLEKASPEEAEAAARNWSRIGGPLFGVGGLGVLVNAMREDEKRTD